ncbi:PAS and ANTAR domain-containing protein [Nocardia sp. NPDC051990]|uniref:PAS and ANTAR domain-containing protein n=1 Tax=Nocardia sp. NPDC051990 TaxID=3155285 RepID=UPI00343E94C9
MTESSEPPTPVAAEGVFAAGQRRYVGGFRFWYADQRWEWSDEVAHMHGYEPGAVTPTTELLLLHKHQDDRAQVADIITAAIQTGESFSSRHRLIDTAGNEHQVIVVADRLLDAAGTLVGTAGYYIDVTDTLAEQRQEILDEELPEIFEARAVIEQAKGILMYVYRINSEQAFRVLQWRSQETNVKLRALAAALITELDTLPMGPPAIRSRFDHLLLTVHERARVENA